MFRPLNSKNVDIHGIDKSKLLIELFNNAKKSKWTKATIGNEMCPDEFVQDMLAHIYQPQIQEKINQLHLSEERSKSLLESSGYVDYIGPVAIKIDFSKDTIDVAQYDELHKQSNISSAKDLVNSLKPEPLLKNRL